MKINQISQLNINQWKFCFVAYIQLKYRVQHAHTYNIQVSTSGKELLKK